MVNIACKLLPFQAQFSFPFCQVSCIHFPWHFSSFVLYENFILISSHWRIWIIYHKIVSVFLLWRYTLLHLVVRISQKSFAQVFKCPAQRVAKNCKILNFWRCLFSSNWQFFQTKGQKKEGRHALLHNIFARDSDRAQLVHKPSLSAHWHSSFSVHHGYFYWSGSAILRLHPSRHHSEHSNERNRRVLVAVRFGSCLVRHRFSATRLFQELLAEKNRMTMR